jgi:hypothetical protein
MGAKGLKAQEGHKGRNGNEALTGVPANRLPLSMASSPRGRCRPGRCLVPVESAIAQLPSMSCYPIEITTYLIFHCLRLGIFYTQNLPNNSGLTFRSFRRILLYEASQISLTIFLPSALCEVAIKMEYLIYKLFPQKADESNVSAAKI